MFRITPQENVGAPTGSRLRRVIRWGVLTCVTALLYIAALVATMPASALRDLGTIPPQVTALYGTIWQGSAGLIGGYTIDWDVRLRDLALLRLRADLAVHGTDTQLFGAATLSRRAAVMTDVAGRAGPGLLKLVPDLPVDRCNTRAIIDIAHIGLLPGRAIAQGRVDIDAGTCTEANGRINPVPAMTATLTSAGSDAQAVLTAQAATLAQVTVTGDRRLRLTLQPEGASLIPGLPTGAPIILEFPF